MLIRTETMPDPARLKFYPGCAVMESGTADFPDVDAAQRSPLATRLFQIESVKGVSLGSDFITVTKADDADWQLLKPAVLDVIMEHFTSGQPVVLETGRDPSPARPVVRTIGPADLRDVLARGLADYKAMPSHVVFLCVIYPVVMLILFKLTFGYELLPLIFPLLAGFTLIGPLVATGIYELSRRREQGLDVSPRHVFGVLRSPSIRAIATLGVVLMAIFVAWLGAAQAIYELVFGGAPPASIEEFARQVLTTPSGWTLIIVGCGVGFLFAVVVLTISVVSFPLLLDRDVGAVTAVRTSVRAVLQNPKTMAMWGLIVAGALLVGALPFFVGLAVVLPVLGHSTWHLYRKVVAR